MSREKNECKIYVGNLPPDVRDRDLEEVFDKYGRIVQVELKNRGDPPFAFVEFEDERDADDAVKYRDGYDFDGYRLRVEKPRGLGRRGRGGMLVNPPRGYRGDPYPPRGGFRGRPGPPTRRTNYRVRVTGLPPTGSWQDLKDHMREAGDVCYSDVFKDGSGVIEYQRYEDMKYALRKLDDTKFRSHEGEVSYIRVKEDRGDSRERSSRKRSRTRSRSRSGDVRRPRRSPSYDAYKKKSRSRSRSRSGRRDNSGSPRSERKSRSRSRSKSAAKNGDARSRSRSRSGASRSRSRS